MPKIEDIVKQLQAVLPKKTDKFNDRFSVTQVTIPAAGQLQFVVGAAHKLSAGDLFNVHGIRMKNPLSAVSFSNGIITFTTSIDHDLTEGWHETVRLEGLTGLDDGDYELDTVPSKTTFTIKSDAEPTLNSGVLLEDRIDGANGQFQVSAVVNSTTIKAIAPENAFSAFSLVDGESIISTKPRISGISSVERIEKAYTQQNNNEFWAFVVTDGSQASYDRDTNSDATVRREKADLLRYEMREDFHVYVVCPAEEYKSGRFLSDEMLAIRAALCKALCGVAFDSGFSTEPDRFLTIFQSDGLQNYVGAYYIHRFTFETVFNFNVDDACDPADTRAFRRFEVDYKLTFDNFVDVKKEADGDLP